jgi:hypothetical protein
MGSSRAQDACLRRNSQSEIAMTGPENESQLQRQCSAKRLISSLLAQIPSPDLSIP